jgi:hypothetical protein
VYYVCEAPADLPDHARWTNLTARRFAEAVRRLWSIENQLHWQLDETFQEDQSHLREGHDAAKFSLLSRAGLSLLKNEHTQKIGIKNKRLIAASDDDDRLQVLFISWLHVQSPWPPPGVELSANTRNSEPLFGTTVRPPASGYTLMSSSPVVKCPPFSTEKPKPLAPSSGFRISCSGLAVGAFATSVEARARTSRIPPLRGNRPNAVR